MTSSAAHYIRLPFSLSSPLTHFPLQCRCPDLQPLSPSQHPLIFFGAFPNTARITQSPSRFPFLVLQHYPPWPPLHLLSSFFHVTAGHYLYLLGLRNSNDRWVKAMHALRRRRRGSASPSGAERWCLAAPHCPLSRFQKFVPVTSPMPEIPLGSCRNLYLPTTASHSFSLLATSRRMGLFLPLFELRTPLCRYAR